MESPSEITVRKLKEIIKNLPDDMKIAIFNSCEGYPYYEVNFDLTTKKFFIFNPLVLLLVNLIRLKASIFFGFKVKNRQLINDVGDCILVCNHQSNIDAILILATLPRKLRNNIFMIGKKELKFLKYIFPWSHIIFVDRGANIFPALKAGADILRQGGSLFIFPEGTRTKDGKLGEFKD